MNLYIQGLNNKTLYPIKFSPKISENYIKIISNIYYINITKTAGKFKEDIIDTNKFMDSTIDLDGVLERVFNDIYKAFLKETRIKVAEFFGVTNHEVFDIPIKTLFRIYPYYLSQDDITRKKYYELTDVVNKLIKFLEQRIVISRFCNPKDPDFCSEPKDIVYDFKQIVDQIENHGSTINKENRELLKKFDEKFKNANDEEEE